VKFQIRHATRYQYDRAVYCEPLIIRLRPRSDCSQRLESFCTRILPEPTGITHFQDLFGNEVTRCWFEQLTPKLVVTTECVVETLLLNPFNYVVDPEAVTLPLPPVEGRNAIWKYYAEPDFASASVTQLAKEALEVSGGETVAFLCELSDRIFSECETIVRHEGSPLDPEATWQQRRGACRDLTVLFNEVCREVGLPARFVSGYGYCDMQKDEQHLHAWSEVYLPGAGWRGFDPSLGLAVSDQHIVVATAKAPADAAPTTGSYRGTGAKSNLETQVVMELLADHHQSQSESSGASELA